MNDLDDIYKKYYPYVFGYLLTLTSDKTLSESIGSDVFYKAFNSIDKFDGRCRIEVWLCQIAKHEYFNHLKKKDTHNISLNDNESYDSVNEYEMLDDKDEALMVHKTLHHLKEPYREVFMLRVFSELSYKDIAAIEEKTEVWARVTYMRAKDMLINMIKEEYNYEM